jgi:hypothetical protein
MNVDLGADATVTDRIALTIPAESRYRAVATLVLGGVGSRLNLPFERMDDLQLALLSILEAASEDEVSVEIDAAEDHVLLTVGPLALGTGDDAGLARVISKLVDDAHSTRRESGEWLVVRLGRTLPAG